MTQKTPVISCRNVWKLFGDKPEKYLSQMPSGHSYEDILADGYIAGVKDVSVDVHEGEMLVIMGLSGSGKSTLMRCMSRLHDITGGTIEVEGQDIMALDEKGLIELRRSKMGMVFQSFGLLPHRTVLENVSFPLEMRGQDKHERRARALEVVKLVGLEGREEYYPRELSGGQQQRVGIARSLAIEPDIWFLDEPFSALDPLIRTRLQDELLELQERLNRTIIFVSHDLDEAFKIGDKIAIMEGGRIVQWGTPRDIYSNPANDYVADFVANMSPLGVLCAQDVMEPATGATGQTVAPGDEIADVIRSALGGEAPVEVAENGVTLGQISRASVLRRLLNDG